MSGMAASSYLLALRNDLSHRDLYAFAKMGIESELPRGVLNHHMVTNEVTRGEINDSVTQEWRKPDPVYDLHHDSLCR